MSHFYNRKWNPTLNSWPEEVRDTRCTITNKMNKNKIKYTNQQFSSIAHEIMMDREPWDVQSKWDVVWVNPSLLLRDFPGHNRGRRKLPELGSLPDWRNIGGRPRWRHYMGQSIREQRAAQSSEIHGGCLHIFSWRLLITHLWRIFMRQGKNNQEGSEEIIPRTHMGLRRGSVPIGWSGEPYNSWDIG